MILNYKTRDVSTKDIYNAFDPPLIFKVKTRGPNGWPSLVRVFEEGDLKDITLAVQIIQALCVEVSDGYEHHPLTTPEKTEDFYQMLKVSEPELAAEILCNLAYNLALDYLEEKKIALNALDAQREPFTNGSKEKIAVSE